MHDTESVQESVYRVISTTEKYEDISTSSTITK